MFGQGGIDGESIFKLVDLLQREKKLPGDATPWMWRNTMDNLFFVQ